MELTGTSVSASVEAAFIVWLQGHLGDAGIRIFSAFSVFGEELIMVLLLGLLYWGYDKKMGKYVSLTVLMTIVWNSMIKNVVLRRRPYFDHAEIRILRPVEPDADVLDIAAQGYSFPSGHASNAASAYGGVAVYAGQNRGNGRRFVFAAAVIALLVGASRVVVGAHYPTDVMAGWLLGGLAIFIVPRLYDCAKSEPARYALFLALTLPGLLYCRSEDYFSGLGLLIGFLAGTAFEERYVNFTNTKNPALAVLRVACGVAVFLALDSLLKLPFSDGFLESGAYGALLIRCVRYAVVIFVDFGIYPIVFRWI